jgi:hypothetical protein
MIIIIIMLHIPWLSLARARSGTHLCGPALLVFGLDLPEEVVEEAWDEPLRLPPGLRVQVARLAPHGVGLAAACQGVQGMERLRRLDMGGRAELLSPLRSSDGLSGLCWRQFCVLQWVRSVRTKGELTRLSVRDDGDVVAVQEGLEHGPGRQGVELLLGHLGPEDVIIREGVVLQACCARPPEAHEDCSSTLFVCSESLIGIRTYQLVGVLGTS